MPSIKGICFLLALSILQVQPSYGSISFHFGSKQSDDDRVQVFRRPVLSPWVQKTSEISEPVMRTSTVMNSMLASTALRNLLPVVEELWMALSNNQLSVATIVSTSLWLQASTLFWIVLLKYSHKFWGFVERQLLEGWGLAIFRLFWSGVFMVPILLTGPQWFVGASSVSLPILQQVDWGMRLVHVASIALNLGFAIFLEFCY